MRKLISFKVFCSLQKNFRSLRNLDRFLMSLFVVIETPSQHLCPSSQLSFCRLACWRSFPSLGSYLVRISAGYHDWFYFLFFLLSIRFSNRQWARPCWVFSQCSSRLLLKLTHDVAASCWVRSHSARDLARSERPYLWGAGFRLCLNRFRKFLQARTRRRTCLWLCFVN